MNPQEIKVLLGEYRERRDRLDHIIKVMAPAMVKSLLIGTAAVPKIGLNKLAKRLGISNTYLSNVHRGQTVMSEGSFERLLDYHLQIGQAESDGESTQPTPPA